MEVVPYLHFESRLFDLGFKEDREWNLIRSVSLLSVTSLKYDDDKQKLWGTLYSILRHVLRTGNLQDPVRMEPRSRRLLCGQHGVTIVLIHCYSLRGG